MALTQQHRASIRRSLSPILGEEEAEAMMSEFASNDDERPASRLELEVVHGKMRAELEAFRGEMRAEFEAFRGEMRAEFEAFRGEIRTELATVRGEFQEAMREQTKWMVVTVFASITLATTISATLAALAH